MLSSWIFYAQFTRNEAKLACFLYSNTQDRQEVRYTQEQIGSVTGMSRVSVSNCLRDLQRRDLVRVAYKRIRVLDRADCGHCSANRIFTEDRLPAFPRGERHSEKGGRRLCRRPASSYSGIVPARGGENGTATRNAAVRLHYGGPHGSISSFCRNSTPLGRTASSSKAKSGAWSWGVSPVPRKKNRPGTYCW